MATLMDNSLLGDVVQLMLASPAHRRWFIYEIERLVFPPMQLGQYRIFRQGLTPVAYVSWAYLTKEAAEGFASGERKLQPADWNAGTELWAIDLIAPYGHVREVVRAMRTMPGWPSKCKKLKTGFVHRGGKRLFKGEESWE